MEKWKDIQEYSGYQVSNKGRIRTFQKITKTTKHGDRRWKDRILKPKQGRDYCQRVELWKDGKHKTFLVHRLEAEAFLGKPISEDMTVNHKDGDRTNNNIENLEWMTRKENIQYGFKNNQYSTQKNCALEKGGELQKFNSLSEASRYIGRSSEYISLCVKRKSKITDSLGNEYSLYLNEEKP